MRNMLCAILNAATIHYPKLRPTAIPYAPLQSVRENSARALADAVRAYPGGEPLEAVQAAIR